MNKKAFFILGSTLLFTSVYSKEIDLLTPTQKKIFETKENIINEEKKVNEKDWLSDINLSTTISKDDESNTSKDFSITYEQDIFKFGAILNTINAAKVQEQYDLLDLKITFDEYMNTIYSTVINLKLTDLNIEKQKLSIKNKTISLEIIKDEYRTGQTDVTELNDTIMEKNSLEEDLIEIERTKEEYLSTLKQYTNLDYRKISIPNLKMKNLDEYLKDSKNVKLATYNEEVSKYAYKIRKAEYLPSLSVSTSYNYDYTQTDGIENYNYGLRLSVPISFSSINDTQKYQLEYLLAQREKEQEKINASSDYKKYIENIKKYKKSNNIALKDIKLYDELLLTVNQEYKAGYKAYEDVEILSNTKQIRELDIKINNLNILTQLITIYY